MDLVIKISDRCNFKCEFCSSNMIATSHKDLELEKVTNFLEEHQDVNNIIVNGGDPLMVSPAWYYDLIGWLYKNKYMTNISFTTNLWDFYLHPEKWEDLFKNHVSVCTSFQYGDERKLADGRVFTEELFRKVFYSYRQKLGYNLKFIAVQNQSNEMYDIKTVELAKDLGTTCRINPALKSGRTTEPYPFYKMVESWIRIMEAGLGDYEDNCILLKDAWNNRNTECPFNKSCHSSIRCMSPNGEVHTCPAIADDILIGVDEAYTNDGGKSPFSDTVIKPECINNNCKCFNLCNSCTKRIQDIHSMGVDYIEKHCKMMNRYIPKLEELLGE